MKFNDRCWSREHRFSIGREEVSGRCYLSIPVSNRRVDNEEYYAIERADFDAWQQDMSLALGFVERCRRREMDHLLLMAPGPDRGTAL
ncbi:hypothetical protein QO207_20300 [Pseudomonas sp. CAN2814]|uniref:hypothetical protein n=1 Tax=Pseudomonas sp. CAN1 TaxID=3046726 RepID=UPI00264A406F|nr:hypothetical protein [Pseudomonas sp. CAN1]MDN6858942.1 hypothetical protein [Pseudomonas sp. CAN1]